MIKLMLFFLTTIAKSKKTVVDYKNIYYTRFPFQNHSKKPS